MSTVPPRPPASSAWPRGCSRPTARRRSATPATQALAVLIGNWINEGATIATADVPSVPIRTSDVYEWVPGGFFVVHTAFGKIGDTSVGGVSIIGVGGDAYDDTFYDSFGNAHRSRLEIDGDVHRWIGLAADTLHGDDDRRRHDPDRAP